MDCSMPGFPVLHHLPEVSQIHVHWVIMPSNHLVLCQPLILLPFIFPNIRAFSNESALCFRCLALCFTCLEASASASVLLMNIQDWFPLGLTGWISLQSKGLSSLLQHHSLEAPVLRCSACFLVQLSHPYMTTGKTIALTIWTFVIKVMCLLFNMLSRCVYICFSSKVQASFNFMAAVTTHSDFGAQENKNLSLFPFFPYLFAMK